MYQIQWTSPKWGQSYSKRDINLEHALYAVFFLKKTSTLHSVSCYENHLLYNANKALYYIAISKKNIIVCICTFISSSLHLFDAFLIYLKEMIKWKKNYLQIMYMLCTQIKEIVLLLHVLRSLYDCINSNDNYFL